MSGPSLPMTRTISERMLLLLLAAVQFTHILDFMVMMPLGPQLMRTFSLQPDRFGLLVASYTFSAAVAGFGAALVLDRFDRKPALLVCYAGFLAGTLGCALAPDYAMLLLARIVSGAFGGVSGALVMTIVGDAVPLERRAAAMGVIMASFSAASVAGVPAGLWMAAHWSWHSPFLMIAGTGAVAWMAAARWLPAQRAHLQAAASAGGATPRRASPLAGIREILTTANSLIALGFGVMMVFGHFIIIPFLSPSLVANAGVSERSLYLFYLAGGIATIATSTWIGRVSDAHGKHRVFSILVLCSVAPVYIITHLGPVSISAVIALAAVFFVFSGGRFVPGQALVTSAVPTRLRGGFMSLFSCTRDLAAGAATLVGGRIVTSEPDTGRLLHFGVLGWLAIAASLLSLLVVRLVRPVS